MNASKKAVAVALAAAACATSVYAAGGAEPKPAKYLLLNWAAADAYAAKYCGGGNDCPDGQLHPPALSGDWPFLALHNTDCTHFVAHVLNAGGVKVPGTGKSCATGLVVRGKELVPWLDAATQTYANVTKVADWHDARRHDIAVQTADEAGVAVPHHLMIVSGDVRADGARVFAHTNDRCGDEVVAFDVTKAWFYRIDAPWDGAWKQADVGGRFRLAIAGADVTWTERRAGDGRELVRTAELRDQGDGSFVVRRDNDDAALAFLGFDNPALRQAIVAAGPKASYLVLRVTGDRVAARWHGLAVKKKANGTLDALVQPGTGPGTAAVFTR